MENSMVLFVFNNCKIEMTIWVDLFRKLNTASATSWS